jgi:hypothetical protein
MLAEAERAAARAENAAASREALGKRVRELVAERVSAAEATIMAAATTTNTNTNTVASSSSGKGPAAAQNRLRKVLKREPIRARLPEGRRVVSVLLTAEERRSQPREARSGLKQMKAAREMAENKAERRRDVEWAKEQEDQRTPEECKRDEEEVDTLHERLRRETPFAPHYERKVNVTNGALYYWVMRERGEGRRGRAIIVQGWCRCGAARQSWLGGLGGWGEVGLVGSKGELHL